MQSATSATVGRSAPQRDESRGSSPAALTPVARLLIVVVLLSPWYRYLRAVVDNPAMDALPFVLEAALLVALPIEVFVLYRERRPDFLRSNLLDRLVGLYVLSCMAAALVVFQKQGAADTVEFLRRFVLPVAVFAGMRLLTRSQILGLLDGVFILLALTVIPLYYEFYAFNILRADTRDVLITHYYFAHGNLLPSSYTWEAYVFPFFGSVIRPFGPMGAPVNSGVLYLLGLSYLASRSLGTNNWSTLRMSVLFLLLAGIVLTVSRTAWGILLLVSAWIAYDRLIRHLPRRTRPVGFGLLAIGLVPCVLIFVHALRPANVRDLSQLRLSLRTAGLFVHAIGRDLASLRLGEVLFGHGFSGGRAYVNALFSGGDTFAYLDVTYQVGFVAAAALVGVFWASLTYARRFARTGRDAGVSQAWILFVLIIALSSLHYQALFDYGIDVLFMTLLALLSSTASTFAFPAWGRAAHGGSSIRVGDVGAAT